MSVSDWTLKGGLTRILSKPLPSNNYKFLLTYLSHLTVFFLLSLHTKQSSKFARETSCEHALSS